MADFVVGNDLLLFRRNHRTLSLGPGNDHFHALLQVFLDHFRTAHPYRPEGSFVDDVGQFRPGGTAGSQGDGMEVHLGIHLHIMGMNLQDGFPSLKIRQFHRHPPVEPARTEQCLIQHFRPVGGRQDDDPFAAVEPVHFRQQLVQGLFPFVVAAEGSVVPFFADGVDFIDKHNTGRLFLGLFEQIPDPGSPHAHEHFNELRTGDGKEGHLGFPGYSLGQQGFPGAGRPHQQHPFGHHSPDGFVFGRVVQVIDDFLEGFLGFILTGHILEGLAGLGGNVHLGIAFAETHHVAPAQFRPQVPHDQLADYHKQQERQDPVVEEGHNGRFLFWDYLREFHLGLYQTADQFRVIHPSRYVNLFLSILIAQKGNPILGDFHLGGFSLIHHVQEIGIADLMDFRLKEHGTDDRIDNQDQQNGCDVIQSDSLRLLVRIFVIHDIFILSAGVLHAFLLIIAQTIVKNNRT